MTPADRKGRIAHALRSVAAAAPSSIETPLNDPTVAHLVRLGFARQVTRVELTAQGKALLGRLTP